MIKKIIHKMEIKEKNIRISFFTTCMNRTEHLRKTLTQNIENFKIVVGAQNGFDGQKYIINKFTANYPTFKLNTNIDDMISEITKKIKERL